MIFLWMILSFWVLWVFYLAVMNLKRVRDKHGLSVAAKIMGYPVLYIGILLDFIVNVTLFTCIFLELPSETLVTTRLQRHANSKGWRKTLAIWLGEALLNDFDPSGNHLD